MNKKTLRLLCAGLIVAASALSFASTPVDGLNGSASLDSMGSLSSVGSQDGLGQAGATTGSFQFGSSGLATPASLGSLDNHSNNNDLFAPPVTGAPEPFTIGLSMAGIGLAAIRRAKARR